MSSLGSRGFCDDTRCRACVSKPDKHDSFATPSPPFDRSDVSQAARDIIAMGFFFLVLGGIAVLFGVLLFLCTLIW